MSRVFVMQMNLNNIGFAHLSVLAHIYKIFRRNISAMQSFSSSGMIFNKTPICWHRNLFLLLPHAFLQHRYLPYIPDIFMHNIHHSLRWCIFFDKIETLFYDTVIANSSLEFSEGCQRPTRPDNGRIYRETTFYRHKDRIRYYCNNGYQRLGEEYRACQNGQWTGQTPTCKRMYFSYYQIYFRFFGFNLWRSYHTFKTNQKHISTCKRVFSFVWFQENVVIQEGPQMETSEGRNFSKEEKSDSFVTATMIWLDLRPHNV